MLAKITISILAVLALTAVPMATASGDHEECGCAARRLGFTIDCSTTAGVQASWNTLVDNNCNATATSCTSAVCTKAYLHVEAHHDHCFHDQTPEVIEKGIHAYEAVCPTCDVSRQYNPALPACAQPTCSDATPATDAYAVLTNSANGCSTVCTTATCSAAFKTIRAYHDLCDEDDIPSVVEEGIHDFEDACSSDGCNSVNATFVPTCSTPSSAAASAPMPAALALAVAAVAAVATVAFVV